MSLISTDQREHLKLLREHVPEVSIDVCKLALDYLSNGPNTKKSQVTAAKLNTTTDILDDAVKALIMLQINSSKNNINEDEFTASMKTGFNSEQISILWQFVSNKRDFVSNILKHYDVQDFRFRELDWRLEARIASRSLLKQAIPVITIKLHLDSETINENKQTIYRIENNQTASNIARDTKPVATRQKREVIVQTDPNNLVYIIDVLEKALEEAKTHRIRNLIQAL